MTIAFLFPDAYNSGLRSQTLDRDSKRTGNNKIKKKGESSMNSEKHEEGSARNDALDGIIHVLVPADDSSDLSLMIPPGCCVSINTSIPAASDVLS